MEVMCEIKDYVVLIKILSFWFVWWIGSVWNVDQVFEWMELNKRSCTDDWMRVYQQILQNFVLSTSFNA